MARSKSPLAVIAGNVAVIHAAGLVLLGQMQGAQPRGHETRATTTAGATTTPAPRPVLLRLAAASPSLPRPPASTATDEAVAPAKAAEEAFGSAPLPAAADTAGRPIDPPVPTASDAPPAGSTPGPDTPTAMAPAEAGSRIVQPEHAPSAPQPLPQAAAQGDEYLPRPLLTVAPQATAPVILPFPERGVDQGRYATILALFIDESGAVRRVRVDGPTLPDVLQQAALQTFMQARFKPGQLKGQAVKSLIRIEVVFDSSSLDEHASRGSM